MSAVPSSGQTAARRPTRVPLAVAILVLLVVAAVVVTAVVVMRPTAGPSAVALPPPTFVDDSATAGSTIGTPARPTSSLAAGWRSSTATATGGRTSTSPAAVDRPGSTATRALPADPCASSGVETPATDLERVTGAFPSTSTATPRWISPCSARRQRPPAGHGDCRFEPANELGASTAERRGQRPSARVGGGRRAADPRLRQLPRPADETAAAPVRRQRAHPARPVDRFDEPIALSPGCCSLSMLFSDWDRSGRRDLRVSNDRHYHRDRSASSCGTSPRRAAAPVHGGRGLEDAAVLGMGIASRDLTGDGYPGVYLTSQADNKLQTLAAGPGQPTFATSPSIAA